jgi:hypothetical protein
MSEGRLRRMASVRPGDRDPASPAAPLRANAGIGSDLVPVRSRPRWEWAKAGGPGACLPGYWGALDSASPPRTSARGARRPRLCPLLPCARRARPAPPPSSSAPARSARVLPAAGQAHVRLPALPGAQSAGPAATRQPHRCSRWLGWGQVPSDLIGAGPSPGESPTREATGQLVSSKDPSLSPEPFGKLWCRAP